MRTELDALLSLQRFVAGILPAPWDVRTDFELGAAPLRPFAVVEQNGAAQTTGAPAMLDVIIPYTVSLFPVKGATRQAATDSALDLREQMWQAVKWGPDARRPVTDRIPLFAYQPRVEVHRFAVPWQLAGNPFTITVAGHTTLTLATTMTAAQIASNVSTAMSAPAGAVTGVDRGVRLWDVLYGGALAGQRVGDPTITLPAGAGATARTLLQGAASPWRAPSDYARVDSFTQNTIADQADPTMVMVAVDMRLTFTRSLPLPSDQKVLQRIFSTADPED